jgi:hypothetical protein
MTGMKPPRFTLRDMFVATALIAVGVAILAHVFRQQWMNPPLDYALVLGSVAIIGAGSFTVFHRPLTGAMIGCGAVVAWWIVIGFLVAFSRLHS